MHAEENMAGLGYLSSDETPKVGGGRRLGVCLSVAWLAAPSTRQTLFRRLAMIATERGTTYGSAPILL